jgi:hypothetical protein
MPSASAVRATSVLGSSREAMERCDVFVVAHVAVLRVRVDDRWPRDDSKRIEEDPKCKRVETMGVR